MEIKKLFRRDTAQTSSQAVQQNNAEKSKKNREAGSNEAGSDTIHISALSRQLSNVSKIVADSETEQSQRVDDIRKRVANGTYLDEVDNRAVAESVISFANDSEEI